MKALKELYGELQEDIDATNAWAEEMYQANFAYYFKDVRELYKRLESKSRPVTDEELEEILTTLPLQLITVSEILSQFRVSKEVVAIKIKEVEREMMNNRDAKVSMTQQKEEAARQTIEHGLLKTVFGTIVNRVDNEITFCKELIMGAKKIWDSRRGSEDAAPTGVAEPNQLPDYAYDAGNCSVGGGQTYIK